MSIRPIETNLVFLVDFVKVTESPHFVVAMLITGYYQGVPNFKDTKND